MDRVISNKIRYFRCECQLPNHYAQNAHSNTTVEHKENIESKESRDI